MKNITNYTLWLELYTQQIAEAHTKTNDANEIDEREVLQEILQAIEGKTQNSG